MKKILLTLGCASLLGASGVALADSAADYQAEVAVADANYKAAMDSCVQLGGSAQAKCNSDAYATRHNAIESARVRATTVIAISKPYHVVTPADLGDQALQTQKAQTPRP